MKSIWEALAIFVPALILVLLAADNDDDQPVSP